MLPDISVRIADIKFQNPFLLASGILDENGYTIRRILNEGAGGAVTKSIGTEERTGYIPPVVVPLDDGLLNAVGLPNPGIEEFANEMKISLEAGKPVIGSVFASNADEFIKLCRKMENYGAHAVELNLSCPHVKGFGSEVGSDPGLVEEIVNSLKSEIKIPVFAKLSPNVTDIIRIAEAAGKCDAFVLINTVRGMAIDITARKPVLSNRVGGLSGHAVKPVGIRAVWDVFENFDKPIFGVGGIENVQDAVEYIMAGAGALQIGTAIYSHGRGIFSKISSELASYMEKEGFNSIEEMRGLAHR